MNKITITVDNGIDEYTTLDYTLEDLANYIYKETPMQHYSDFLYKLVAQIRKQKNDMELPNNAPQ